MHISNVLLILLIMALFIASCAAPVNPTPTITSSPTVTPAAAAPVSLNTITGSFRNQIGNLESNMPRADSEQYVIPTEAEQTDFTKLVSMIRNKQLGQAMDLVVKNHYMLNYYVDRGDNYAVSYLLREQKPIQRGWGLYAFRMNSTSNIIVEAPHPLYDRRTPSVALNIYRALDARALLVAGAHRHANSDESADVAHAPESIFQSVHLALSRDIQAASGDVIILQIHGFHTTKHADYPQVVFGFGEKAQAKEIALAEKIKDALAEQGITAGLCTGTSLKDLCAKTNLQGSTKNEVTFIHIELDENLRKNDEALVAALVQVFNQ